MLHVDVRQLGEDLAVEVLVEVVGVAAVGEQRDREAGAGVDAHERRLPQRVAVVAVEPLAVPVEADPAEAPRVAERVLVGQLGLERLHLGDGLLGEQARAVLGDAAGHVQAREGEQVRDACGDEPGGAGRALQPPRGRDDLLFTGVDVSDGGGVEDRLLGQRHGVREAERREQHVAHRGVPRLAGEHLDDPAEHAEARVAVRPGRTDRVVLRGIHERADVQLEVVVAAAGVGEDVAVEPATCG